MRTVPQYCSLDGFTGLSSSLEGVELRTLAAFDTIHVHTRHSNYRLLLLDPERGRALVQGGRFFAEPVEAEVNGASFGSCMLKMGWIGVGLRMEIFANGQPFITSPVQSLRIEREEVCV